MNTFEQLKQSFFNHIQRFYIIEVSISDQISFEVNSDPDKSQFGDINTNIGMILAKFFKINPRQLALTITESFTHEYIEKIEIAGPGFINFFVTDSFYTTIAQEIYNQKEAFFKLEKSPQERINIEFVSANPTGPLHFGHGRNAIIGDVLARVFIFLGYQVTKEFYINDAGAQIIKLGRSLKIRCEQALGSNMQLPEDAYHGEYLLEVAKKCIQEHGEDVIQKSDLFFQDYGKINLLEQIKKTLTTFNIEFDHWFSEKELHTDNKIDQAISILEKNKYLYLSEGALWFRSTDFGDDKDRVLKKQDGTYTYVAADIAYMLNKLERGFDKLIMVLGHDHHSYEFRLKALLQALGYQKEQLSIILYQLVNIKNKDGEMAKMSKRSGNIVTLEDIIQAVGCDVARFFFLHRKSDAELDFDVNLALTKSNENPVYYIQYAYVRTHSLLEKAEKEHGIDIKNLSSDSFTQHERLILKKIISFKELILKISTNHQIHLISYFTYELANLFNTHYNLSKMIDVENPEKTKCRLFMVQIVQETIAISLSLLGLTAPQKM